MSWRSTGIRGVIRSLAVLGVAWFAAQAAWAGAPDESPIPPPPPRTVATTAFVFSASNSSTASVPLAVCPPVEMPGSPGGQAASGTRKSGTPETSATDPFVLPPDYKNADGTLNEDSLVAQQRRRLEVLNEKLKGRFRLSETPHYLIFSDTDAAMTANFVQWSERLYEKLGAQFGLDPKGRVWNGKCVLTVFATRQKFETYATCFDGEDARQAGAYFACETYGRGGPNLVHICIPADERGPQHLQELFAHEGTHAFFQLYRCPVALPLWLHEGMAEYMTVVNDPSLATRKNAPAKRAARRPASIASLFTRTADAQLSLSEYAIAYSLVDFLQKTSSGKFRQMVDLLKAGKEVDEAMTQAYGFGLEGLEQRWKTSLAGDTTRPRQPNA